MKGQDVIDGLKRRLRVSSDAELARRLGITGMSLHNWKMRVYVTARQTAGLMAKLCTTPVSGQDVIDSLGRKLRTSTDAELARRLGITHMSLLNWNKRPSVTARQVAGLVHKACVAASRRTEDAAVRPVVEFFPIVRSESRQGATYKIFSAETDGVSAHPYLVGLRDELESSNGVYVFFDSRGQALYVGKARKQSLWSEMTNAFNRTRGDLQTIRRVKHPERRQRYRTSDEKARQPVPVSVPLHELAHYFSAYRVSPTLVGDIEALLVRSFANNLLNKNMEKFVRQTREHK